MKTARDLAREIIKERGASGKQAYSMEQGVLEGFRGAIRMLAEAERALLYLNLRPQMTALSADDARRAKNFLQSRIE